MKILDIRETAQGVFADVMLNEKSILPMSVPVTDCPPEDLINYLSEITGCTSQLMTDAMIALTDEQDEAKPWNGEHKYPGKSVTLPAEKCEHTKGKSAEGNQLRCAECGELFEPRNYSEVGQVTLYGNGKSLKGYTQVEIQERELNPYHDGIYRH